MTSDANEKANGAPAQPETAKEERKDIDPSTGRSVPYKKANQPFLVHQRYLAKQARKEELKKARAEGRTLPPSELDDYDDDAPIARFFGITFLVAFIAIGIAVLSGLFFADDALWGYRGKWTNWRTYIPHVFTPDRLMVFNGDDDSLPVLVRALQLTPQLSIKGDVFDVSAGRMHYRKGSPYHNLAGRDASRAFVTGCFATHLTHDLRGLSRQELDALDNWHKFFKEHHTYYKVGRARLPPIDPASPVPEPCMTSRGQKPA